MSVGVVTAGFPPGRRLADKEHYAQVRRVPHPRSRRRAARVAARGRALAPGGVKSQAECPFRPPTGAAVTSVTDLDLPAFDNMAADLTGAGYPHRRADGRRQGWLATLPPP